MTMLEDMYFLWICFFGHVVNVFNKFNSKNLKIEHCKCYLLIDVVVLFLYFSKSIGLTDKLNPGSFS